MTKIGRYLVLTLKKTLYVYLVCPSGSYVNLNELEV